MGSRLETPIRFFLNVMGAKLMEPILIVSHSHGSHWLIVQILHCSQQHSDLTFPLVQNLLLSKDD